MGTFLLRNDSETWGLLRRDTALQKNKSVLQMHADVLCVINTFMKKSLLTIIVLGLISNNVFAAGSSKALDKKFRYCDDITSVDKLLDRSREDVKRLKDEGVNIERIVVSKDRKELYLISGETVLRIYPVAFGSNPVGHKQFEGDGKTPEGLYSIDFKNPNSEYTKALHVSYPNKEDVAYAKSQGKSAGGDIMIHGFPTDERKRQMISVIHPWNWTRGCIAVNNEQIADIYSLVKESTLVEICKATVEQSKDGEQKPDDGKTISIPAK